MPEPFTTSNTERAAAIYALAPGMAHNPPALWEQGKAVFYFDYDRQIEEWDAGYDSLWVPAGPHSNALKWARQAIKDAKERYYTNN